MKPNGIPAQSQVGCLAVLVKMAHNANRSEGTQGHRHLSLKTQLIHATPVIPALEFHIGFLSPLKSEAPYI